MAKLQYRYPIILASESIARHNLLVAAQVEHQIVSSEVDEELHKPATKHYSIADQAYNLAKLKAIAVTQKYPEHLVIAADQIGELSGKPFFKPLTQENNIEMLKQLSGHQHKQHTVTVIYLNGKECHHIFADVSLTMRALTLDEINVYVEHDQPWLCCGGYRFEGLGKHLFTQINGEADTVLGLPMITLLAYLHTQRYIKLIK